jgi:hypothetical protein
MLTSQSRCLGLVVVSWVRGRFLSTRRDCGLTGYLPDDEGAKESVAEDEESSDPFCVFWVGEHVVDKALGCQCHGECARWLTGECLRWPEFRLLGSVFNCAQVMNTCNTFDLSISLIFVCF